MGRTCRKKCPGGGIPACRQAGAYALRTMTWYTYALKSKKDEYLYIGMTSDIERRLKQHNSGKTISNRHRIPFEVLYSKEFQTRQEARTYEVYLKSGVGREFLKAL